MVEPTHPIQICVCLSYLWVNMDNMGLEDVWVERHAELWNRYKNIVVSMCLGFH